jgi:uncharacterized protein (DUF2267 family)
MPISLSAETQELIERQMKEAGLDSADELVQTALQTFRQLRGDNFDQFDAETQMAIEQGFAQADRGESRPWEEVREELRTRFIDKK